MRNYELVVVLSPEADDEGVAKAMERVNRSITEAGGQLAHQEQWGMRKLAYPIRRYREGKYVLTRFSLEPSRTREVEATLKASTEVIRHLLVTTPAKQAAEKGESRGAKPR
ncbi:MAG: 30S ribosomal protein S6, partial [Chloroflexi bacterium]|nr:30S ribosomal protein S6 [Chloroflexota bacterium]